jgi:3',5'-cyclic AMP phosphodiesterase CpdA
MLTLLAALLTGCPYLDPWDALPAVQGEHWLRLVQVTDIHITDEESPARIIAMDSFVAASWRPHEAYAAQVLDATCRLINRIHALGRLRGDGPVDFVLFSGDLADNAQYNELRWFIDTVDGGWVVPDSGALDGPFSPLAEDINPNLPFRAAGLSKDIPWYAAIGNHDILDAGNFFIDRSAPDPVDWVAPVSPIVGQFLGLGDLSPPQTSLIPTGSQSLAVLNAGDPEPIDPHTLQLVPELLQPGAVVPDPNRHYLSKRIFIRELFNTRSFPAGHGFAPSSTLTGIAQYSFRPRTDVPIRVIVMDSEGLDAIPGYLGADGVVSLADFEGFLKPQVRAAKAAGEYVIVVTHHPTTDWGQPVAGVVVTPEAFIGYLASQPNILAHVTGHTHYHGLITHEGPYPYPEFITASLIDYPQEARTIDVYYDRRNEVFHLRSTFVTHAAFPRGLCTHDYGSLRRPGRTGLGAACEHARLVRPRVLFAGRPGDQGGRANRIRNRQRSVAAADTRGAHLHHLPAPPTALNARLKRLLNRSPAAYLTVGSRDHEGTMRASASGAE